MSRHPFALITIIIIIGLFSPRPIRDCCPLSLLFFFLFSPEPLIAAHCCLILGIFFVLPCIESYQKVDLRTITLDVPPQEVIN